MENYFSSLPMIIEPSVNMTEPNGSVLIYEGVFNLSQGETQIGMNGRITYEWLPTTGVQMVGDIVMHAKDEEKLIKTNEKLELSVDGLKFGDCYLTSITVFSHLEGNLSGCCVLGDKTVPVDRIIFSIPNLKSFIGLPIKKSINSSANNRLVFENDEYLITVDKCGNFQNLSDMLESRGGFIVLYGGQLTKKNDNILHTDIKELVFSFTTFLNFLNGRRCSLIFLQGQFQNETKWTDYSNNIVDQYKPVFSWTPQISVTGFNDMWKKFSLFWRNTTDRDFLITVIHWYVEANGNAGFIEGSIIMAQTALELLYNWLIIEKKKIIIGKDGDSISASNKIRLLLATIGITTDTPSAFDELQKYVSTNSDIVDGVDAIVAIRNAIVHAQEEKRKKLMKLDWRVKYQALQLSLGYVEIIVLYILGYSGVYHDRFSNTPWVGQGEITVPWNKPY